jgi:cobalt-zinc-cadmium efflux system membrane fusion protein
MNLLRSMGLLALTACVAPSAAPHAAPASVENPISETDLTRVRMHPEAVARLGIETTTVEAGAVADVRLVGGEVVIPPGRTLTVTAPVGGVVRFADRARWAPGSSVVAGETLLRLTAIAPVDRDVHARADREIAAAEAALVASEARVTRNEALMAERAGSARALEDAMLARDIARADLEAARTRAATVRRAPMLSDVTLAVRAPEDGIVRTSWATDQQAVAAGAPLLEVVAVDALEIRVPVYAGDLGRLTGGAARVRRNGARESFEATPAAGPPTAEPDRMTVDRFYVAPTEAGFAPGERVLMELPLREVADARTVPTGAIVYDAWGGTWLYRCDGEGDYVRLRVDVARRDGDRTVLARGPAIGTCVVSVGAAEIFGTEFPPGH